MGTEIFSELFDVIMDRIEHPREGSYVCRLISEGKAAEKIREESEELIDAAAGGSRSEIIHEAADLLFHLMVLIAEKGVTIDDVANELRRRRR
jgi:phosphoribosyl-ATP pyrophosphohydrolase